MADTKIEWTERVWNPVVGCSVVSPGCTNCYAMRMAGRLAAMGQPIYQGLTKKTKAGHVWTGKAELSNHGQLIKPLSWKKPRRIFVNSMSDLFHESLPDDVIDMVFAVMALCPQHTFQVLTKRSARMRAHCADEHGAWAGRVFPHWAKLAVGRWGAGFKEPQPLRFPLPNVWLGVSVEDQERADERIPDLLATPAAVRFLSCEPLLGPVDVTKWMHDSDCYAVTGECDEACTCAEPREDHIDWVICGGESGPRKRPTDPEWHRSLRDQCKAAGVAFYEKQIDKVQPIPDDLLVREFPRVAA